MFALPILMPRFNNIILFIKIALKLSYFFKKMQNFRALKLKFIKIALKLSYFFKKMQNFRAP